MDHKHDIVIKQEKEEIKREDNNDNYLNFALDVHVKVENDVISDDWCIQNVLAWNDNYQGNINCQNIKEETQPTCMLCGDYFGDSYSLLQHNLVHLRVPLIRRRVFMCEHCPYFNKNKSDLQIHITTIHLKEQYNSDIRVTKRQHKCVTCNKTYSYKHWFSHMREVHGQLDVKCEKCHLRFKCARYLRRHIMFIHEGVKRTWHHRFKTEVNCPKCPKILSSKSALTTHLRNCHSTERFTCHICQSMLKCKSYLQTHLKRVHFNDGVVHQCDICGKTFKSPRYVRIHVKNSHYKTKKSLYCLNNKTHVQ